MIKGKLKRLVAVLLSAAVVLLLLPTMLFADVDPDGTEPAPIGDSSQQIVKEGGWTYYDGDVDDPLAEYSMPGNDTDPYSGPEPGDDTELMINKSIRGTDTEDEFIIDLEVWSKRKAVQRPRDTAVTLVLDVSASMNWSLTANSNPTGSAISRLTALRAAVQQFLVAYAESGGPEAARWLSIVVFDQYARAKTLEPDVIWIDAWQFAKDYQDANGPGSFDSWARNWANNNNNIGVTSGTNPSSSGTNVEAGLLLARNHVDLLDNKAADGDLAFVNDKYVFLFSDGAPCFVVSPNPHLYPYPAANNTYNNLWYEDDNIDDPHDLTSTGGSGLFLDNFQMPADPRYIAYYGNSNGTDRGYPAGEIKGNLRAEYEAKRAAQQVKDRNVQVFAVGCGAGVNADTESFLKDLVTDPNENYFKSDSLVSLLIAFENVLQRINTRAWMVTDPMGQDISYIGAEQLVSERYNDTGFADGTLMWDLINSEPVIKKADDVDWFVYEYSYRIKLDTDSFGAGKFDDGVIYKTNKKTTLSYYIEIVDEDGNQERWSGPDPYFAEFEVPAVKPFARTLDLWKTDDSYVPVPLKGAKFILYKLVGGVWTQVGEGESGEDGFVLTGPLPFGPLGKGSYKLVETELPGEPGDYIPAGPWCFDISYGQVTYCTAVKLPKGYVELPDLQYTIIGDDGEESAQVYRIENVGKGRLIVEKRVSGFEAGGPQAFDINIQFNVSTEPASEDADIFGGIMYQMYDMADPELLSGYEGYPVFRLRGGQWVEFSKIPSEATYQVFEEGVLGGGFPPGYSLDCITFSPIGNGSVETDEDGVYFSGPVVAGDNGRVTVYNIFEAFSVEVDKDTIRRTSAAYSSSAQPALDEISEGVAVENVGVEQYIYEIDFRSVSSEALDSFVVEDPLEGVAQGKIRLDEIWTPIVYGILGPQGVTDPDAAYRIFYKINDDPSWIAWPESPLASESWQIFVYGSSGVHTFGLSGDDFVTALKFDFGVVAPNFTSKNYQSASINGEYRDGDGKLDRAMLLANTDKSNVNMIDFLKTDGSSCTDDWTDLNIPVDEESGEPVFTGMPITLVVKANKPLASMAKDDIIGSANVAGRLSSSDGLARDQDAVITRNLGVPPKEEPKASFSVTPLGAIEIVVYKGVGVPKTGDAMVIQIPLAAMAAALAGIILLVLYMRSRKRSACAEAGVGGAGGSAAVRQKRAGSKRPGKGSLLSLLITGLLVGIAFQPAPADASSPQYSQYQFKVDGVFTEAQFEGWLDELVDTGQIPPEIRSQIYLDPTGWTHKIDVIRVVDVTIKDFVRNDVDILYKSLDAFIAEAMTVKLDPSQNTIETKDAAGKIRLADKASWAPTAKNWEDMVKTGGIKFVRADENGRPGLGSGRPGLDGSNYSATAVCRGIEKVKGWSSFMTTVGDPTYITTVVNYFTASIAAGGGAGGAGAGGGGAGAGGGGGAGAGGAGGGAGGAGAGDGAGGAGGGTGDDAAIPPEDTPTADQGDQGSDVVAPPIDATEDEAAAKDVLIADEETPLAGGDVDDAGAKSGGMPWWVWIVIVVVIGVFILIVVGRKGKVGTDEA